MGEQRVEIAVVWPDVEELPVYRANQFIAQVGTGPDGPEDLFLTIGLATPPVILGTEEEQRVAVAAIGAVSVKGLARISMSRARAAELAMLLENVVRQWPHGGGGQAS